MANRGPQGFTVVRCGGCAGFPSGFEDGSAELPGVDEVLLEGLRALVRDSGHGMLVTAGCPFGPATCAAREPGMLLLVQPCGADREPVGPVTVIGPVRGTDDVRAVTRWLVAGTFDAAALPERLRGPRRVSAVPRR